MANKQPLRHWRVASSALLISIMALSWAAPSSSAGQDNSRLDYSKDSSRVVSSVHDQGRCSYSWAIAVVSMLEGQQANEYKLDERDHVRQLSHKMLIDCLHHQCREPNFDPLEAFAFVEKNGIALASAYSEQSENRCKPSSQNLMRETFKATVIERPTDKYLVRKLRSFGPIMVGVNYELIRGKTIDPCDSAGPVNHYVTLVGYGTYNGQKYYKYVSC